MTQTPFKISMTIAGVIATLLGLWGAWFYQERSIWLSNLFSDLFGSGILVTIVFLILIATGIFNDDD
tara:strand:+ start:495 stop:695 length:201 start_codon:yes stop_codon:yes gene_type:complete